MAKKSLVLVRCNERRNWGSKVNVGGTVYSVDGVDGLLHACNAGVPLANPGCDPDVASLLLSFAGEYSRPMPEPPEAPAPAPEPEPEPEPEEEEEAELEEEEEDANLDILDLSIGSLEDALDTGDHDDDLETLLSAENAGKTRKGAVTALEARIELLEG